MDLCLTTHQVTECHICAGEWYAITRVLHSLSWMCNSFAIFGIDIGACSVDRELYTGTRNSACFHETYRSMIFRRQLLWHCRNLFTLAFYILQMLCLRDRCGSYPVLNGKEKMKCAQLLPHCW
jgi:hypothetical protein